MDVGDVRPHTSMNVKSASTKTSGGEAGGSGGGHRRPMNAFLLFCKRHRTIVKEVYPNLENRHITKILGEFWGSLNPQEKMPFNDLAASYKDHLMKEQPPVITARKSTPMPVPSSEPAFVPEPMVTDKSDDTVSKAKDRSQGSSGSSSPEPGSGSSSSSAPKPFKKRYLAAEKAKISGESIERKSACEALLKLAEGSTSASAQTTNGNAASNKVNPYDKQKETAQFSVLRKEVWTRVAKTILTQEEEKGKNATANHDDKPINLSSQCLIPNSTIIEHIVENILNDNGNEIASANNTTTTNSGECSDQVKEKILQSLKDDVMRRSNGGGRKDGSNDLTALWKMLPNPTGGMTKKNGIHSDTSSSAASKTMGGKEKAHSAPASQTGSGAPSPKAAASESVSVTLVTETDLPLNLSKTPPQTPGSSAGSNSGHPGGGGLSTGIAITITTTSPAKRKLLDDDDDDVRRSSRACKGRRYQEFKDAVGRRGRGGRAGGNKSDGEGLEHSEDEQQPSSLVMIQTSKPTTSFSQTLASADTSRLKGPPLQSAAPGMRGNLSSPFDLDKALMAIPALRPEEFQRRVQASRQQQHRHLPGGGGVGGRPQDEGDLQISATVVRKKNTKAQKSVVEPMLTSSAATGGNGPPSASGGPPNANSHMVVSSQGH